MNQYRTKAELREDLERVLRYYGRLSEDDKDLAKMFMIELYKHPDQIPPKSELWRMKKPK